jgi:hypothetical protein
MLHRKWAHIYSHFLLSQSTTQNYGSWLPRTGCCPLLVLRKCTEVTMLGCTYEMPPPSFSMRNYQRRLRTHAHHPPKTELICSEMQMFLLCYTVWLLSDDATSLGSPVYYKSGTLLLRLVTGSSWASTSSEPNIHSRAPTFIASFQIIYSVALYRGNKQTCM